MNTLCNTMWSKCVIAPKVRSWLFPVLCVGSIPAKAAHLSASLSSSSGNNSEPNQFPLTKTASDCLSLSRFYLSQRFFSTAGRSEMQAAGDQVW